MATSPTIEPRPAHENSSEGGTGGKLVNAQGDVLGGALLVGATLHGLTWADSPWGQSYEMH